MVLATRSCRKMLVSALAAASLIVVPANALSLDLDDETSTNSALSLIADGLMDYYEGYKYGGTIGMMTSPYYWWEAGAAWGSMIDHWFYTGNDTYVDTIKEALTYQVGSTKDFMPSNQTTTEGNDDQGFWGIAAMQAAERNFSNPSSNDPQWLYLAQAVFEDMVERWDSDNCGGGLRWQIYTWNAGYDYKNSVSNGCMFNLAARLARYTGNTTYSDWAEKIWKWVTEVEFVNSDSYVVYDGAKISGDCETPTKLQWTYNYGLFMSGCAYMYAFTNNSDWSTHASGLFSAASVFFQDDIMYEAACQPAKTCNNDQRSFKAIFSRFLGLTGQLVPDLADKILTYLKASAVAAASSCSGGTDGHTCGMNWLNGTYDGYYGLGEQMSALEVIQNTRFQSAKKPLTNSTGGTSSTAAGKDTGSDSGSTTNPRTIYTKDKAGSAIATIVFLGLVMGTGVWMLH